MKIKTSPVVSEGVPCVTLEMGEAKGHLTARQAEEVAEALTRAATAARYEAAIAEMIDETFEKTPKKTAQLVARVRELIERRRLAHN